jgi:NAD-dependent dihydropyrimidine dehydrogenase PreA subunit
MALFIEVEVAPDVAKNPDVVKKLVEVCPVNIFAQGSDGALQIVEKNLDECTLCELCLEPAPPGKVRVKRLYGDKAVLERK